jgi:hypothetical protein
MGWVEDWVALASPPSSSTQNRTLTRRHRPSHRDGGLQLHRSQFKPQRLALASIHGLLQFAGQLGEAQKTADLRE